MSTIGNLFWVVFGGFFIFLYYFFASLFLCITIVGIPFGVQTMKLAMVGLLPFNKEIRAAKEADGCIYLFFNILWIFIAGIELAIIHLVLALLFAITVIGIPFATQHIKLAKLALFPFGKEVIDK